MTDEQILEDLDTVAEAVEAGTADIAEYHRLWDIAVAREIW